MSFDYRVLGRLKAGAMNKTEAAYATHLEWRKSSGEVLWFKFGCINLRLADQTFYKPDFLVVTSSHEIECHEVKGFMTDDAHAKIKIAADLYPFPFKIIRKAPKSLGGWDIQTV